MLSVVAAVLAVVAAAAVVVDDMKSEYPSIALDLIMDQYHH